MPGSATIEVEIAEARSLMAADKGGKSDPYAVAELISSEGKPLKSESQKTKTKKSSRSLDLK